MAMRRLGRKGSAKEAAVLGKSRPARLIPTIERRKVYDGADRRTPLAATPNL